MTSLDIATALDMKHGAVRLILHRLLKDVSKT